MTVDAERNWAGNLTYSAQRIVHASSIAEAQDAVAAAERVRPLGTRHSFNGLADTPDTLVTVTGIDPDPELDEKQRTLAIGAGARYGDVAQIAEANGWALHNMGSLPHISVGGAIATGTHGSGNTNGVLSTAVRGLQLITPGGELLSVGRRDPSFDAMVVGLGAFGLVVRVTLDVEPSYRMRQVAYRNLPWVELLGDLQAVMGSAYSVSVFTDWRGDTIDQIWLKSRLDRGPSGGETAAGDHIVDPTFRGATLDRSPSPTLGGSITGNFTVQGGTPGAWLDRLPHFRLDATPSHGDELQTEYFVDLAHAPDALEAVRSLSDVAAPYLIISELRTVAADELWLSPAYRRPALAVHFTWRNDPDGVATVIRAIEEALAPFEPRPHWGKVHSIDGPTIATRYPRIADFRALADTLDPGHKFRNATLDSTVFDRS